MRQNFSLQGKKNTSYYMTEWGVSVEVGGGNHHCNPHWNNYQARIIMDAKTTRGKTVEKMEIIIVPEYYPTDYTVTAKWKMYVYSGDLVTTCLTKWSNLVPVGLRQPGICTSQCETIWGTKHHLWVFLSSGSWQNLIRPLDIISGL